MKAVILAAGKGTRLRPLTDDKPKRMATVDDRPIFTEVARLQPWVTDALLSVEE